jgi:hypothetical protein
MTQFECQLQLGLMTLIAVMAALTWRAHRQVSKLSATSAGMQDARHLGGVDPHRRGALDRDGHTQFRLETATEEITASTSETERPCAPTSRSGAGERCRADPRGVQRRGRGGRHRRQDPLRQPRPRRSHLDPPRRHAPGGARSLPDAHVRRRLARDRRHPGSRVLSPARRSSRSSYACARASINDAGGPRPATRVAPQRDSGVLEPLPMTRGCSRSS